MTAMLEQGADSSECTADYIGLICARGGSKGLPGKNLRVLAGKPLIGWAIEHAREGVPGMRIIVSTDAEDIAAAAARHGGEVPFMRPVNLAHDDTPEFQVWRHALHWLQEHEGGLPSALVVVPATAPLRSPADIARCVAEFERGDADVVITVTDSHRNPYFNMVVLDEGNRARLVIPPAGEVTKRQDAPMTYDMTTVAYVVRSEFVLARNRLFDGRVRAVHVPPERAVDIDTPHDMRVAECLIQDAGSRPRAEHR